MTPVIRIPDDVFQRLQALATPLVDTPGTVIKRLLDMHEPTASRNTLRPKPPGGVDPSPGNAGEAIYETYENTTNRHVTIHRVGCSQLRKRGGVHRHGQGAYKAHSTLREAGTYARSTGLPIKLCGYCKCSGDDVAGELVMEFVRANPEHDWQEAEIKGATGVGKDRVRGLLAGHVEIDQQVLAAGAVRWKSSATEASHDGE